MTDGLETLQPISMLHTIISRRYFDNESCGWLKGMNKEPAKHPEKAASRIGGESWVAKNLHSIVGKLCMWHTCKLLIKLFYYARVKLTK